MQAENWRRIAEDFFPSLWGACRFDSVKEHLLDCRAKAQLFEGANSILCAAFPYYTPLGEHNVSRYAVVPDYHMVVSRRLEQAAARLREAYPQNRFVYFADNSPIPEVYTGCLCGLGVKGDNGLLIHKTYGSWVFLGEIVTDLELGYTEGPLKQCPHCGMCQWACPNAALHSGEIVEARCLSYISQKKQPLSQKEETLLLANGLAWGCDTCQNVCPLNHKAQPTPIAEFLHNQVPLVRAGELDHYTERAFSWRPKAVLERNLRIFGR